MKFLSPLISENNRFIYVGAETPNYIQAEDVKHTSETQKLKEGELGSGSKIEERSAEELKKEAEGRAKKLNQIFKGETIKDLNDSEKTIVAEKIRSVLEKSNSFDSGVDARAGSFEGLNQSEFLRLENNLNMEIATTLISLEKNGALLMEAMNKVIEKLQTKKGDIDWTDSEKFTTYTKETNVQYVYGGGDQMHRIYDTELSGIEIDNRGLRGETSLFSREDIADLGDETTFITKKQEEDFLSLLNKTMSSYFKEMKYCAYNDTNFDLGAKERKEELQKTELAEKESAKQEAEQQALQVETERIAQEKAAADAKEAARMKIRDADNKNFLAQNATEENLEILNITIDESASDVDKVKTIQQDLIADGQYLGRTADDGWAGKNTNTGYVAELNTTKQQIAQRNAQNKATKIDAPITPLIATSKNLEMEINKTDLLKETPERVAARAREVRLNNLALGYANNPDFGSYNSDTEKSFQDKYHEYLTEQGLNKSEVKRVFEQAKIFRKNKVDNFAKKYAADAAGGSIEKKEWKKTLADAGLLNSEIREAIKDGEYIAAAPEREKAKKDLNKKIDGLAKQYLTSSFYGNENQAKKNFLSAHGLKNKEMGLVFNKAEEIKTTQEENARFLAQQKTTQETEKGVPSGAPVTTDISGKNKDIVADTKESDINKNQENIAIVEANIATLKNQITLFEGKKAKITTDTPPLQKSNIEANIRNARNSLALQEEKLKKYQSA